MELSDTPHSLLFDQMLQMFPNVPENILRLYTHQYSNDAETCARMLDLRNSICDHDFNSSSTRNELPRTEPFTNAKLIENINRSSSPENYTNNENIKVDTLHQNCDELFKHNDISNNLNHVPITPELNLPDTESKKENICPEIELNLNESSSASSNVNIYNVSSMDKLVSQLNDKQFQCELHIDVDLDEESLHSWRPNPFTNIRNEDFFLPKDNSDWDGMYNSAISSSEASSYNAQGSNEISSENFLQPFDAIENYEQHHFPSTADSASSEDYIAHQKLQLNVLKYEISKAKMEQDILEKEIAKLSLQLKEQQQLKNTLSIKEINEENASLRVECQCLCMEVDYCACGEALLGEIEEDSAAPIVSKPDDVNQAFVESSTRENDCMMKWECSECTYINCTQVDACEMCQTLRPLAGRSPPTASNTCYCHSSYNHPT